MARIPNSTGFGTPIKVRAMPTIRPNRTLSAVCARKYRLRRSAPSLMASVVRCKWWDAASRIRRSLRSWRWDRKKMTNMTTSPAVVSGSTSGCSTRWATCIGVAPGWWTSTGVGLVSSLGCGTAACVGLSFFFPTSWLRSPRKFEIRSSMPPPVNSRAERIFCSQILRQFRHLLADQRADAQYDGERKRDDQDHSRKLGQSPAPQQSHRWREQEREQNRKGQRQKDRL